MIAMLFLDVEKTWINVFLLKPIFYKLPDGLINILHSLL